MRDDGTWVAIGRQLEEYKFFFTLSCRKHHHLRTVKAVHTHPKRVVCPFCAPPRCLKGACMRLPTEIEREMRAAFERLGLGDDFVSKTKLPCWHGQVDFWSPRLRIIFQVDGPRHFVTEVRVKLKQRQATKDADMCTSAWAAGLGVVRVHHLQVGMRLADADVRHAMQLREQNPGAPFILLSAGFAPTPGVAIEGQRDAGAFVEVLESAVGAAHTITPNGSVLFMHANPQ